jgi:hypothetical protein
MFAKLNNPPPMTRREQLLLGNVLDALDRLYDGVSKPIDIYALVVATSEARRDSEFSTKAQPVLNELQRISSLEKPQAEKKELALVATDDLRLFLAGVLPSPH